MKRKIITNQNAPKAQENPKDFSELLKAYNNHIGSSIGQSGSFWKLAIGVAAACIVGFVFFQLFSNQTVVSEKKHPTEDPTSGQTSQPYYDLDSWKTSISNTEETLIISPTGVIIEIPEQAFIASDGTIIEDSVTLELTQYDDALSILLSQIPMHYDSAGVKYHFQSDGMFNLSAFAGNEEVQLTKSVSVHYPQTTGRSGSNTYFLDNNEWNYAEHTPLTNYEEICEKTVYKFNEQKTDNSTISKQEEKLAQLQKESKSLQERVIYLEKSKPLEPRRQNLSNYRFVLDVNPSEFPELTSFDDVVFEVKDSRFNFSIYEETWNDIAVKKSTKEGRYLITLKNTKRVEIFDVYPVLSETEFTSAFHQYSDEMKEIEERKNNLSTKINENKKIEQQFLADLKAYKQDVKRVSKRKRVINQLTAALQKDTPYRSVDMSSLLRSVNFDIAVPLPPKGFPVPADFVIADSNHPVNGVSLINISENIYYDFSRHEFSEFRYMKGKKHILVAILPDGQLAAYREDLTSDKIKRGQPHRFVLKLSPSTNIDELRDFLQLGEAI